MTREEATAILNTEADFLFGNDKPYNRQAFDMAVEALQDCGKYKGAYEYICECIDKRLEDCEHETELFEADMADYGVTRKCFEVRVKKELLTDIIQIVEEALEEGSKE